MSENEGMSEEQAQEIDEWEKAHQSNQGELERVKRYDLVCRNWVERMELDNFGEWVQFDDIKPILDARDAEIERLKAWIADEQAYLDTLKAEAYPNEPAKAFQYIWDTYHEREVPEQARVFLNELAKLRAECGRLKTMLSGTHDFEAILKANQLMLEADNKRVACEAELAKLRAECGRLKCSSQHTHINLANREAERLQTENAKLRAERDALRKALAGILNAKEYNGDRWVGKLYDAQQSAIEALRGESGQTRE